MSVLLFAKTLLETAGATITTGATAAGFGKERLSDRDRGPQMKASAAGQFDVDIVLPAAAQASHLAIVNHNAGGTVTVYADTASAIGTTSVATLAPSGIDPFLGSFTLQNHTKYRLRFASFGSALQVGEILLGVPRTITQNPFLDSAGLGTIGNVEQDRSPAGYVWSVSRGPKRAVLGWRWTYLPQADLTELEAALAEVSEGAKNLLVQDQLGASRWMTWLVQELQPVPLGNGVFEVPAQRFEEAL